MGKIIQIASAGNDGGMMLYALCDDGRLWEFRIQTGWVEIPLPIPSPNSDYAKSCECGSKEDCYATAVKIKEENMEITNILELEFESNDLGKKVTIREFFHRLMQQLWVEKERFSGKCPFGNSSWEGDIIVLLIQKKLISGKVDEDGAIEEYSENELTEFVKNKILKPLFSK